MITQPGRIEHVDAQYAWVTPETSAGCGSCSAKSGCGTSLLAGFLQKRRRPVKALNKIDAIEGQSVVLQFQEDYFLKGVAFGYGLPLLMMLGGGLCAQFIATVAGYSQNDLVAFTGTAAGLVSGLYVVRHWHQSLRADAQLPVISKLSATDKLQAITLN